MKAKQVLLGGCLWQICMASLLSVTACNASAQTQNPPAASPPAASLPSSSTGHTEAATQKPIVLSNRSISFLMSKGWRDDQIIQVIRTHDNNFQIDSGAQLMKAHTETHISTAVLTAMAKAAHGPNAIHALAEYLVAVKDEPAPKAAALSPAPPVAQKGLGNQDIFDMVQQKVPDTAIIKIIQSSASHFTLMKSADFDDVIAHGVSRAVLVVMAHAAGEPALAAGRQWEKDVKQRALDASRAETDRVARIRAQEAKECPGCASIIFYEFDADHNKYIANSLPERVLKAEAKYTDIEYAKAHHILVATDPKLADYQVIWTMHEHEFHFHTMVYDTGISSTGESVMVGRSEPSSVVQTYYNMLVFDQKQKEGTPPVFKSHHANIGVWKMHKADLECWQDVEKYLGKMEAGGK